MARHSSARQIDRRKMLQGMAAAGLASLTNAAEAPPPDKPILEGYTDRVSYQAGDAVAFHVSSNLKKYAVEIARIGGQREVVSTKTDIAGAYHAMPEDAPTYGCRWPAAFQLPVPAAWKSGYYSAVLRGEDGSGKPVSGEIYFVVRPTQPGRDAKILIQLTTNTYNAYNTYGGGSFYGGRKGQRSRVSFDRPYAGFVPGDGFTSRYSGYRRWEQPFVEWAERGGYRIDYAANSDLEFHPEILKKYRLVLSVGHDEYWSSPMRDHLEAYIANGGNAAFFSGNSVFWQVRSVDNGRTLVSWKQHFEKDPVYKSDDHRLLSGMWSHRLVKRPENQLTGVSFAYGGYHRFLELFPNGAGAYTVHRPDHWIFAGTGIQRGDLLGDKDKIVGYECDGCEFVLKDGLPIPTHRDGTPENFAILGTVPAGLSVKDNSIGWVQTALYGDNSTKRHAQPGAAVMGCYTRGGTVFTTGCTDWTFGLRGKDPQVGRITRNILDRLSA